LLDGQRGKDVGIADVIVVEEIHGASPEFVGVEKPAAKGNGHAKLMLLVALALKRQETATIEIAKLNKRARDREQRRRLIVMSVEGAKNLVEARDAKGNSSARTGGILDERAREVRLADAANQSEPGRNSKVVLSPSLKEAAVRGISFSEVPAARRGRIAD
jgi:hypothetical protein